MAQFTTQGRLKLFFNGEGVSSILDQKDPFLYKCRSVQTSERKTRCIGSSARIYYASTSSLCNKNNRCNAGASSTAGNGSVHHEDDDEDEDDDFDEDNDVFDGDGLSCFRGLVLDIAYSWFDSKVLVVVVSLGILRDLASKCRRLETCYMFGVYGEGLVADVLEYYAKTVNSPSGSFYIPAVLRVPHLLQVVKRRIIKNNLSRKNILFRDNYTCQYCSSRDNLTIDHVVPAALGGEWTWENLVTACAKCNSKKGKKTLEEAKMKLIKVPKAPKDYDILAIPLTAAALRMLTVRKGTPEEWRQYLRSP
ncbi:hypothetical protein V8G54_018305 [Vigna mungo]|uniref:HNH nuclease domain-containing protein n=1 Tax=Vigna mungo TaxID=3915 RepID=A0AAQ3RRB3_VIGMU